MDSQRANKVITKQIFVANGRDCSCSKYGKPTNLERGAWPHVSRRNKSGNVAMWTALLRASFRVSNFAAFSAPAKSSK